MIDGAMGTSPDVTVVIPVKNEARSIEALLDALFAQTMAPTEICVTDGGSTDGTVELIQRYMNRDVPIRLERSAGIFPGRGRNLAINASHSDWVALIDAGCVPEPQWLEALLRPVQQDPAVTVVFGVVRPMARTLFTQCASTAAFPAMRLPSGHRALGRSVASLLLHRSVWERAGRFPEHARSGEDLIFMKRIEDAGAVVRLAPEAVVHWEIPATLPATVRRFARYSQYSLEVGLGSTWHARAFLYYAAALSLLILGGVHSIWWWAALAGLMVLRVAKTIAVNEKEQEGLAAFAPVRFFLVGGILLAIDLATIYGAFQWVGHVWQRWLTGASAAHESSAS